jgi:hypothetical protein
MVFPVFETLRLFPAHRQKRRGPHSAVSRILEAIGGITMQLNSLQEIERAIDALSPEHREELSQWLDERYSLPVDAQLKADIEAGRFDDRIARAVADDKTGKTQPL